MMVSPPTAEKLNAITEEPAKSMAGVRINTTDGKPNPKHKYCKNCKRVIAHEAAKCYQLERNAATRPDWWKQEIHGIS